MSDVEAAALREASLRDSSPRPRRHPSSGARHSW